jgi:Flp pilus assembly protein TadD
MKMFKAISFTSILAMLVLATGCTTTSHVSQMQSVSLNSNPSSMSELHIADVALNSGDVGMATTIYERVARANPNSVLALTGLGNTLYAVGDFTRAGVYFEQAHKLDPAAEAPQLGIARVAIHQRRFDDAVKTYREVLAKSPQDMQASSGLGVALDMQGNHEQAQAVLREALLNHPGDPTLSINLGLSLVMGGDPRQGANVLLDVTRYPAAPPQARQDLALAYGLLGNSDSAREILSQDLPKDQIEDNLRYYAAVRDHRIQVAAVKSVPVVQALAVPMASPANSVRWAGFPDSMTSVTGVQ